MRTKHNAAVSVRLRFTDDARLGPGKIALLEAVARHGSIAGAGRDMNMSYRRAWLLIDSLNRMFDEPVVLASPGGAQGGGASLSTLGTDLVRAYRAMEAETVAAIDRHFEPLRPRMRVDFDAAAPARRGADGDDEVDARDGPAIAGDDVGPGTGRPADDEDARDQRTRGA